MRSRPLTHTKPTQIITMNIKTVSSAYFVPLPKTLDHGKTVTDWVNLARISVLEINEHTKTAKIYTQDEFYCIYTNDAYDALILELRNLYNLNTRQRG